MLVRNPLRIILKEVDAVLGHIRWLWVQGSVFVPLTYVVLSSGIAGGRDKGIILCHL